MFPDIKINPTAFRAHPREGYQEVGVIATFNQNGQFRPLYVQVKDDNDVKTDFRVAKVIMEKDSKISGCDRTIFFVLLQQEQARAYEERELLYWHEERIWYMR